LMLYAQESGWNQLSKEQQQQDGSIRRVHRSVEGRGSAAQFELAAARCGGKRPCVWPMAPQKMLDGPYVEAESRFDRRLHLIDVADLDAAISWASRCPGASHGVVEVRPIWSMATSA
jgi:hypothetical protein